MSLLEDLHEQVVILRRPEPVTAHGGRRLYDWSTAAREPWPADVQQDSTSEDVADRQTTSTKCYLVLPAAAGLSAVDRVEWQELAWEVEGEVASWDDEGQPHHLEAVLRRVAD